MNYNIKVIVARVAGDEVCYDNLYKSLERIPYPINVLSVSNNVKGEHNIWFKYNACIVGLKKDNMLLDNDIVIFAHNDISIIDPSFKEKIEMIFNETDVALIGVVGTSELKESGCWWDNDVSKLRGHIEQGSKQKKINEGFHLTKGGIGFFNDAVAMDGLILITLGKYLKESNIMFPLCYDNSHFYDIDFSLQFLLKGYQIAIADIAIYHQSEGASNGNDEWTKSRNLFIQKCHEYGIEFPINQSSIKKWKELHNVTDKIKSRDIVEIEI